MGVSCSIVVRQRSSTSSRVPSRAARRSSRSLSGRSNDSWTRGSAIAESVRSSLVSPEQDSPFLPGYTNSPTSKVAKDQLVSLCINFRNATIEAQFVAKTNLHNIAELRTLVQACEHMITGLSDKQVEEHQEGLWRLQFALHAAMELVEDVLEQHWVSRVVSLASDRLEFENVHNFILQAMHSIAKSLGTAAPPEARSTAEAAYSDEAELVRHFVCDLAKRSSAAEALKMLAVEGRLRELYEMLPFKDRTSLEDLTTAVDRIDTQRSFKYPARPSLEAGGFSTLSGSGLLSRQLSVTAASGVSSRTWGGYTALEQAAAETGPVRSLLSPPPGDIKVPGPPVKLPHWMPQELKTFWWDKFNAESVSWGGFWPVVKQACGPKLYAELQKTVEGRAEMALARAGDALESVARRSINLSNDGWVHVHELQGFYMQALSWAVSESPPQDVVACVKLLVSHFNPAIFYVKEAEELMRLSLLLPQLSSERHISACVARFVPGSRAWAMQQFDSWVRDPIKRVLVIYGAAGHGKSSLAAVLCRQRVIAAYHATSYDDVRQLDQLSIVKSLAVQLARCIPALRQALMALDHRDIRGLRKPDEAFEMLLRKPLVAIDQRGLLAFGPIIVVDGLAQSENPTAAWDNPVLRLVIDQLAQLPNSIRLVLATRPMEHIKFALDAKFAPAEIVLDGQPHLDDLKMMAMHYLEARIDQPRDVDAAWKLLVAKSQGSFLYLSLTLEELEAANKLQLKALQGIGRDGLEALFTAMFSKLFAPLSANEQKQAIELLEVLVAAREPPTVTQLDVWLQVESCRKTLLPKMGGLLIVIREDRVMLPHKTLYDWLIDPSRAGSYYAHPINGHRRIAKHNMSEIKSGLPSPYSVRYAVAHHSLAGDAVAMAGLVLSLDYWEAVYKSGVGLAVLRDLVSMGPPSPAVKDCIRWLQRDNHILLRYPTMTRCSAANTPSDCLLAPVAVPFAVSWVLPPEKAWDPHLYTLRGHVDEVWSVAASNNGQLLATGSSDWLARLWDARAGTLVATLDGHKGPLTAVAFSPDSSILATASRDKTVKLWDVVMAKVLATIDGHKGPVLSLAFSPDGGGLATGGEDFGVRLWNAWTGAPVTPHVVGHNGWVQAIAFSADSRLLAAGSRDRAVMVWDLRTNKPVANLAGHTDAVTSASFSPTVEGVLATASCDHTVIVWDVRRGTQMAVLTGHSGAVNSVAFSPSGTLLATASTDHTSRVYETGSDGDWRCTVAVRGHPAAVLALTWTPFELLATAAADRTVRVWDPAEYEWAPPGGALQVMVPSPDGSLLATASNDGSVALWSLQHMELVTTLQGHSSGVLALSFSPDSTLIATASGDCHVRLWAGPAREKLGVPLAVLEGHVGGVLCLAFSKDSKLLATGSSDKTVRIWDVVNKQGLKILNDHKDWVLSLAFSPVTSDLLATTSADCTARLYHAETAEAVALLKHHKEWVRCSAFSPNGKYLATGGRDGTACLWSMDTGKLVIALNRHEDWVLAVAFSPDNTMLATASGDRSARLWSVPSGQLLAVLTGHSEWVTALAFSPNGQYLATASGDRTARLWSARNGKRLATLEGHTAGVQHAKFTPDSTKLLTAGLDGSVRLWDASRCIELDKVVLC